MTKAKQMNMWAKLTDKLWKKIALGFVLIVFAAWFGLGIFTGFSTSPRYELNKRAFQKLGHPDDWQLVAEPASKDFYFLCSVDDQSCGDYVARFRAADVLDSESKVRSFAENLVKYYESKGVKNDGRYGSSYVNLCGESAKNGSCGIGLRSQKNDYVITVGREADGSTHVVVQVGQK